MFNWTPFSTGVNFGRSHAPKTSDYWPLIARQTLVLLESAGATESPVHVILTGSAWEQAANVMAYQAALRHVLVGAYTMTSLGVFIASVAAALSGRTILSGHGICNLSVVDDEPVEDWESDEL